MSPAGSPVQPLWGKAPPSHPRNRPEEDGSRTSGGAGPTAGGSGRSAGRHAAEPPRPADWRVDAAVQRITLEPFDWGLDSQRLRSWLAEPYVARWWGDADRAMEHARRCAPESHALIVADGVPVGYLCWREPLKDELESAGLTDLPRGLVDIDILVGEPGARGRGVGARALQLLVERLRREPAVAFAGLGTSVSNTDALRCFANAGFRRLREFQDPEWGPCRYLIAEVRGAAQQGDEPDGAPME